VTGTSFSSRSGREFTIRDLQPEDTELLVDLFHHLSPDTIYKRFHSVLDPAKLPAERVRQEAARLARVDGETAVALIILHGKEAVGVARFHRIPGTEDAESAIVIRDDCQKDGLGTFLLQQLGERAQAMGIHHLVALVQAQNHPILKVISRSGLQCKWRFEHGETYLAVDIRGG
jgi:RimJ/RimL family protein N-acetyltransferase